MLIAKITNNKLFIKYDDFNKYKNKLEKSINVFNPLHKRAPFKFPKYLESTYTYYDKHHIEDKVLEFSIGWTFYFATEMRSEVSNPEELD
jgi:hypothetical protein